MEINAEMVERKARSAALGVCAGFTLGFILGAAVVAILDYNDEKRETLKRIKRDSDENYYYTTD